MCCGNKKIIKVDLKSQFVNTFTFRLPFDAGVKELALNEDMTWALQEMKQERDDFKDEKEEILAKVNQMLKRLKKKNQNEKSNSNKQ